MNGNMVVYVSANKGMDDLVLKVTDEFYDTVESIAKDAPLTKTQKIAYGVLTVGGQYAWTRTNRYITERGWGELEEVRIKVYGCGFMLISLLCLV